jgi:hypothetical protein
MSIEIMSLVLNHSKATGRAKLVLIGIANHQGDQGAWPSIATLARYANASESSVQRDIRALVELGELRVELQSAPTKSQYKTNLYWVTIAGVSDTSSGVSNGTLRGVKSDDSGVSSSDPQNIIKKPKETLIKKQPFSSSWKPDEDQLATIKAQYPSANIDKEIEAMIDYILAAGKEKEVKDMAARFRTWLRNADKYAKGALSKDPYNGLKRF